MFRHRMTQTMITRDPLACHSTHGCPSIVVYVPMCLCAYDASGTSVLTGLIGQDGKVTRFPSSLSPFAIFYPMSDEG